MRKLKNRIIWAKMGYTTFLARFRGETLKVLEELARIDESSVAQVIRTAVSQYIRKRKKTY